MLDRIYLRIGLCLLICLLIGCKKEYSSDEIPDVTWDVDDEKILKVVNRSIDYNPERAYNYYIKAKLLSVQGKNEEALENAKLATDLDHNSPDNHFLLAKLYAKTKQHDKALQSGLMADKLGTADPELDVIIANQYLAIGAYSRAFDYLNNAIAKQPESHENYYLKGLAYLLAKDTVLAEKSILKSISMAPDYGEALFAMVDISITKGKQKEGRDYLRRALEHHPYDRKYVNKTAEILIADKNVDSAKVVLTSLVKSTNDDFQTNYLLSSLYFNIGRYDSAQYYGFRSFEKDNTFSLGKIMAARAFDRVGNYKKAEETYQSILEGEPDNNLAVQELEKLKRKVAYLWQLKKQQEESENMPVLEPKKVRKLPDQEIN